MGKESISNKTFVKGLAAGVVVAASLGILQAGEYSINSAGNSSGSYTAGTYTATAEGIGQVSVEVTFDETRITGITVDVSGETAGIGADIGDEMVEKFMAAQSSEVDGIAGATVTSDALKAAVADCIAQASSGGEGAGTSGSMKETEAESASGTESVTEAESVSETENVTEAESVSETENVTEAESVSGTESVSEAEPVSVTESVAGTESVAEPVSESEDVPDAASVSEAESSEEQSEAEMTEASEKAVSVSSEAFDGYTPGTYTASAEGNSSEITVSVTFDEADLLDITADVSGETVGLGAEVGEPMILRILEAQSTDVDSISGATVTSDALKAAVADCMVQAAEAKDMAAEKAPAEEFTPGVYTASAEGNSSDVTVTVTFDEDGIADITADVSGETIGAEAGEPMVLRILEAQSADVDGISGATVTSDAVKAAVADCMEQAGFVESAQEETPETEEELTEAETETETAAMADTEAEETEAVAMAESETETKL